MKTLQVAMLHWFTTPLDLERVGGVVRVELSQLREMHSRGVYTTLYGRQVRGQHPYVQPLGDYHLLGRWRQRASLVDFVLRARSADIWHGANMPALAWLRPEQTLVFYSNNADSAPLLGYEQRRHRYQQAHYAFCSRFTRDDFLSRYPDIPEGHCLAIHEGVDTAYFCPPRERPSQHDGVKRLFFLGQWTPEKGIWVLLEAIRRLREIHPQKDYRWVIGGSPYYWKVDSIEARGIEDAVYQAAAQLDTVEVIGEVKYDEYPSVLQQMDIFVNPAVWQEPFPLVNMEAMAAGLPVVTSAVGGIPELAQHEVNGLLVPPSDAEALARAVCQLLDAPACAADMARAARRTVEEGFTWQHHGDKLLAAYQQVLGRANCVG